jgi:cell division septum initiation protein DivIVA
MPDQSSAATEHAILQEITAPLETLPDDPLAVVNADFPVALRGYDRLAVDAYVQQTAQLVAELQATRSPEAAVRRALERVGEQISGILQRAHETAEQITAQSRGEAEDRLEQARVEAAEIIAQAQRRVSDLDADTDRIWIERHRIVDDSRQLAQQLVSLAEAAAERFPPAEPAPYDEEADPGAATRPPITEEPHGRATLNVEDDDIDEFEEETAVAEPSANEIEKTVAFSPLDVDPGAAEPEAGGPQAAEPDAGQPEEGDPEPPEPAPRDSRRSNSVIPPASQAANRRTSDR